jgi:uncharacterized protein (DUF58 family)
MLAELRRLELRSKRSVSSQLSGRYRSAFRGSGLVFSDIRQYQPGDDTKHIHWKVTARTGVAHSKSFEEDRLLSMLLLVDCSASAGVVGELLSPSGKSTSQKSLELAALLTLLARQNGDAVGLGLFSEQMDVFLPPSRKRSQSEMVLSELLQERTVGGKTSLATSLDYLSLHQRARSIVFIISDFFSTPYSDALRKLAYRHDVIGIYFADAELTSLPDVGLLQVRDPETGSVAVVDSSSRSFREKYASEISKHVAQTKEIFTRAGADFLSIEGNPLRELSRFMDKRVARIR